MGRCGACCAAGTRHWRRFDAVDHWTISYRRPAAGRKIVELRE
jgi:hypothetical protein